MVGIGKAAQKQILIKDASALENLHKINALVIDKTGTLTIPQPEHRFHQAGGFGSGDERDPQASCPGSDEAVAGKGNRGLYDEWRQGGSSSLLGRESRHQALPEQGAAWRQAGIGETSGRGKQVAMVGDGINDTQAFIACQREHGDRKGTDVAMDVAQITLMSDDLWRFGSP